MSVDDQIEDAIALSRRTLLIGTASAIAALGLATASGVFAVESGLNYARRLITDIFFGCEGKGAEKDAVAFLRLARNDETIHRTAINVRGFYRWRCLPDKELALQGGDYASIVVDPVLPDITYNVVLRTYDMDYDGYWLPFVESHKIPGGKPLLNRLTLDPPSRKGPGGRIWAPPPIPKIIDPRDLPPAHYRNLDL